ncbi:uncharacterized protein PRCAT00005640001 [Priceomyces carsonii]|uniref:uncharacterized protein n=1 Tax=Priceomyces carsonii TaxID=28549 RepID=UPI002ED93695|nr:unnamed protein product [Priceomyces carsonii]
MLHLTNELFNEYVEAFQDVILTNCRSSNRMVYFDVIYSYVKRKGNKSYIMTHARLTKTVDINFTICFDDFYSVPVFHFRLKIDGVILFSTDLISKANLVLGIKNVAGFTLEAHPLFDDTWFLVHPCEALSSIDNLLEPIEMQSLDSVVSYFVFWYNTFGLSSVIECLSIRTSQYSI